MLRRYKLNLRGVDTKNYSRNPVVLNQHDHTKVVGKAKVLKGKLEVDVDFMTDLAVYQSEHWTLGTGIIENGKKELIEISVIPVIRS